MAREEPQPPDELKELERELRALVPRGPKLEMARVMYLAGQASMSPVPPVAPIAAKPWGGWGWPAATGLMSLVALWLGAMLIVLQTSPAVVHRPDPPQHPHPAALANPPVVEQPQTIVQTQVADPAGVQGDGSYLRDRQTALDRGVEALPQNVTSSSPDLAPGSYGSLRGGILREPRRNMQRATMWTELWK